MFKEYLALALALICSSANTAESEQNEEMLPSGSKHMVASVRHIEAGGIGYQNGYTTLEFFLASDPNFRIAMPFLDLRGHVFNNGRGALNTGIGFRGLYGRRVYGANIYYDYRTTHRKSYNQIGAGIETLGSFWDLRINGYFPVGSTISKGYDSTFDSFQGNSLLVNRKFQYAMTGFDAEAGFHFSKTKNFDFYAAFGPYYFKGKMGDGALGGKARIAGYYKEYITLELSDSYDSVFRNNFQGQVTFTIPFGPKAKSKITKTNSRNDCSMAATLNKRMIQPVGRQEIIVIDQHKKTEAADNTILFVNNTSNSAGTYESPFPRLEDALAVANEGDIIYIYPGDGTSTGLDAGATPFVLQNNQQLLGAATPQIVETNFGSVTIPAQAQSLPLLTADTNTSVIQVADGNVISGLHILMPAGSGSSWAIGRSGDITNLSVLNNLFESENSNSTSYLVNLGAGTGAPQGLVTISNNQFLSNNTAPYAIYVERDSLNLWSLNITGNTFTGFYFDSIACIFYDGTTNMVITNNQFLNASNEEVLYVSSQRNSILNLNFSNNSIENNLGLNLELYDDAKINCTLNNNDIYVYDKFLYMYSNDLARLTLTAKNNSIASDGGQEVCIHLDAYSGSQTTLNFSNNQINVSSDSQITEGFYLYNYDESSLNFNSINNRIICTGNNKPYSIFLNPEKNASVTAVIQGCEIQALGADQRGYGIHVIGTDDATIDLTIKDNTILASNYGFQTTCISNVHMIGEIRNNTISTTAQGAYAVSASMEDICALDLSLHSNQITGAGTIEITSTSTNSISANFTGNTLYGQGEQALVYLTSGANGIMNINFDSNTLIGNTEDSALRIIQSAGTFYFEFQNNHLTSGGFGILSDTNTTGSNLIAHVIGNTLQTASGDSFTAQMGSADVCLRYENNLANVPNSFFNYGAGIFTLYYNGNNQTYTQTGTTPGTSTSCPPIGLIIQP